MDLIQSIHWYNSLYLDVIMYNVAFYLETLHSEIDKSNAIDSLQM